MDVQAVAGNSRLVMKPNLCHRRRRTPPLERCNRGFFLGRICSASSARCSRHQSANPAPHSSTPGGVDLNREGEELSDVYFHRYSGWRMAYSPAVSDQRATSGLLNADRLQWIAEPYGSRLEGPEVTLYRVSTRLSPPACSRIPTRTWRLTRRRMWGPSLLL